MVPSPQFQLQGMGAVSADALNSTVQGCANVAQMRAVTGVGQALLYLEGYSGAGDGGQGHFVWTANAPGPDDGVNVIKPQGVGLGAWVRLEATASRSIFLAGSFGGGLPALPHAFIDGWDVPVNVLFPPNFLGSNFHAEITATAPYTIAIMMDGTVVGSVTTNPNNTFAYSMISPTGLLVPQNHTLTYYGPAIADATLANFYWTLVGVEQ